MPELPFAGQVALITGGAKRIGRSIALQLAKEGADIVVNYKGSKAEADELVSTISAAGRRAVAVQGDVSKGADVKSLFAEISRRMGRLDILVNNAGMFFTADILELKEEQWDAIMATNLKAHFLCAQAAAPLMKQRALARNAWC